MIFAESQPKSDGLIVDYSYADAAKRTLAGETISRNIHWYRMWWSYLSLALELNGLGWKIRVNRRYYREWDLDSILGNSFSNWWKEHKRLFVVEPVRTMSDSTPTDNDHLNIVIPRNRDKASVLKEIEDLLEGKIERKEKFPFSDSKATYLRLHMQYNIFIKHFHGEKRQSRESIRIWVNEIYKPFRQNLVQTKFDNQGRQVTEIISAENGITNNVRYAKDRILSVGQGIFP